MLSTMITVIMVITDRMKRNIIGNIGDNINNTDNSDIIDIGDNGYGIGVNLKIKMKEDEV